MYTTRITNHLFREFVFQFQDNINVPASTTITGSAAITYAINYKSAPVNYFKDATGNSLIDINNLNLYDISTFTSVVANGGDYPETPHFTAQAGKPLRLRLLHTGGLGGGETFTLHGHSWQEEPYTFDSTVLGYNPMSQQFGFRDQLGPLNYFDLLIDSAGGENAVPGDYLYNDVVNLGYQNGVWGIMTVNEGTSVLRLTAAKINKSKMTIAGSVGANPVTGQVPSEVRLKVGRRVLGRASVGNDGSWTMSNLKTKRLLKGFVLEAENDGTLTVTNEMLGNVARKTANPSKYIEVPVRTNVAQPGDTKQPKIEVDKVKTEK